MERRIIDVHNHPNGSGTDVDGLVRNMDEQGIEKAWLMSWEIPLAEYDMEPFYYKHLDPRGIGIPLWMIVEGLKAHPDRFIGGWAPDFRDRHARPKLYQAVKLHGIKVYGELKLRTPYDHPDGIAMYRYCGQLGLPVLFHLECSEYVLAAESKGPESWPFWYGGDFSVVENMCRLCPDTAFIGHATGFWREISGDAPEDPERYPKGPVTPGGRLLDLMRRYPNLFGDLSASAINALRRDLTVTRDFLVEFQDRILVGRDGLGRHQMDVLEKLDLDDDVLDKICYLNAERLVENAGKGI